MFSFFNKIFKNKSETQPENTPQEMAVNTEAQSQAQPEKQVEETVVATQTETEIQTQPETPTAEPEPKNWTMTDSPIAQSLQPVQSWASDMVDAVKDKAEELELRAGILAEEASEAVEELAQQAEDVAYAVGDKLDELSLRANILADEASEAVKESIESLVEETPKPELLPEDAPHALETPVPAEAATKVDDKTELPQEEPTSQPENEPEIPAVPAEAATNLVDDESEKLGWAARLARGLTKSRDHMAKSLASVFGGGNIDEDLYEELETVLITSDMGIEATEMLMKEVRRRVSLKGLQDGNELRQALKDAVYDLLKPLEKPLKIPDNGQPFVIMMAGINGAGKTTSIGKLAKYFQSQGKSVILAAGDTFRAAAREQLQEWGARNGVTVIAQEKGDSAAVCFDAVEAAKARKIDIVLADTAGRLPTQLHLMEEIKKVKRVLQKSMPDAPHEVIVVLDANIGQNAVNQVMAFDDALGVTGLIVTKLDGTARGGVLAALAGSRAIPVRYIGVGESIDDLRPFNARAFVDALLDEQK
ncbi:signal recognition particle-docking protein FtsY [Kingella negevensis]|uniref:signal recognition particle-docking protein FtsY n=1 Tax=Kingella negevensis TaxID=1522312 RepID=UPI000AA113B1|nr:signal recognition particle-docking protein FtsY [Kingella negevensis]MDK4689010.1 signal recognition particle-docking protein FtsY [Kingella negevensis]WII90598.1 signal recognition particle-docking protein FtsY [Kingella negevensis]